MDLRYIDIRTNPEYRYDEVLHDINRNFSSITGSYLSFSGGTVTGDTYFSQNLSASTYYSGSTPLETIIYNIANSVSGSSGSDTYVQPGLNTYTGGTASEPTVNISAATLSYLSAATISGATLYSGSTNLYSIFAPIGGVGGASTYVQPGTNITTGGTASEPTVNLVDSPSINNLSFSGTATGNAFSAATISGATLYSGSTNLYSIFAPIGGVGTIGITIDGGGSAITTGVKGYVAVPNSRTITGWYVVGAPSGSIVIDVWKANASIPTVANTITGTEKPTLSSSQYNSDLSLSTWTTALVANDVIVFNVDSATTITKATIVIVTTAP